jgi:uncharacterized repeat protein (TIGR04138 family)
MEVEQEFEAELKKIIAKDPRYSMDAYVFVRYALDYTVRTLGVQRHVTGQELLEGIRQFALDKFGPMVRFLFREWGVETCEDFGNIVFNMVDNRLLGKTEEDSIDDFSGGYDFYDAFEKPYK